MGTALSQLHYSPSFIHRCLPAHIFVSFFHSLLTLKTLLLTISQTMAFSNQPVLVFGPTGAVGCSAAVEARRRGAHVYLAMRDTSKSIRGLGDESEGYTRIQADLADPDSLTNAVKQSGAESAFVYTLHGSPDYMVASFKALASAGIIYVVLLSSVSVKGLAREEENMQDYIRKVHAMTELSVEDAGIVCASIRPAYFSSNVFQYLMGIRKGEVDVLYPDVQMDYIVPSDIGTACGTILCDKRCQIPDEGTKGKTVYLCGPKLVSQRDAFGIISEAINREIKVNSIAEDEWYEKMSKVMPKPVLESIANGIRKIHESGDKFSWALWDEGSTNLRKYIGGEPQQFKLWVEEHKADML
jgi:uncharacterized protein YbjT (DUF2867 family)